MTSLYSNRSLRSAKVPQTPTVSAFYVVLSTSQQIMLDIGPKVAGEKTLQDMQATRERGGE